jgi:hypothetical protein
VPAAGLAAVVAGLVLLVSPLHIVGAVIFVVGCVVVGLTEPDLALLAVLVLFPFHPLLSRFATENLGVTGASLWVASAWKEATLAAVLAVLGARLLATNPDWRTFRPHLMDALAAVLVAMVGLGMALHPGGLALNEARLLLFPVGVYVAIRLSHLSVRRFFEFAAIAALGFAVFLIVQSSFFGWAFVTSYWGTPALSIPYTFTASGLIGPRGAGTLASPNDAALILGAFICMLGASLLVLRERRWWHAVVLAVAVVGLTMTFSRSGIAGALVGVAVLIAVAARFVHFQPRRGLGLLLAALVVAGALSSVVYAERGGLTLLRGTFVSLSTATDSETPPNNGAITAAGGDPSTSDHLASISDAFTVVRTNPLGVGLGTVGARPVPISGERPQYVIESWYLSMGVSLGWIGLAWTILLPIGFVLAGVMALRRGRSLAGLALVGAAVCVGIVGVVLPSMMEPELAMIPWALAALAVGSRSVESESEASPPPPSISLEEASA